MEGWGFRALPCYVVSSQVLGVMCLVLTGVWMGHFHGGYAWDSSKQQFSVHPLCMVMGLVFLYGDGEVADEALTLRTLWLKEHDVIRTSRLCKHLRLLFFLSPYTQAFFCDGTKNTLIPRILRRISDYRSAAGFRIIAPVTDWRVQRNHMCKSGTFWNRIIWQAARAKFRKRTPYRRLEDFWTYSMTSFDNEEDITD